MPEVPWQWSHDAESALGRARGVMIRTVSDVHTAPSPGTPRTPEDAAALAHFNERMALPIILAAVVPLFLVPDGAQPVFEAVVFIVAWAIFVVDFVVHQRRLVRYLSTWLGRFD